MKHDELQEDLAFHLRGNTARMVWTNTQLGPSGSPRPDVFTVDKSYARFAADAYEVKVSVSDLRRDTTSGKWQSYRKFAHRVWFAFERGLVPLSDIPHECGVILRNEQGQWRSARKPVAQVLDTLPRDAWLKLLIDDRQQDVGTHRKSPRTGNEWRVEQIVREKLGQEAADLFRDRQRQTFRYQQATSNLAGLADQIEKEIASRREQAKRDEARVGELLDGAMKNLGLSIGMREEEITAGKLQHRLAVIRNALNSYGMERAIDALRGLQAIITDMEEKVPA